MFAYVVYKNDTGEITNWRIVENESMAKASPDCSILEGQPSMTSYVDTETMEFKERPELPEFSNPYDLTALPSGTIVKITDSLGTEYEITDLTESLILEGPETYALYVDPPFPYIAIQTTVEVA